MQVRANKKVTMWNRRRKYKIKTERNDKHLICVKKLVKIVATTFLCVTIVVASGILIQRANICLQK